nr:reverse transcriptase domain-containing protein [uncultured Sphaerochaeta sp.]
MLSISDFEKNSALIQNLINKRVRLAKQLHDKSIVSNYSSQSISGKKRINDQYILKLMPARRDWIKLRPRERFKEIKTNNGKIIKIPLDSIIKNKKRILNTIKRDLLTSKQTEYLQELEALINRVRQNKSSSNFSLSPPCVIPIRKDYNKNDTRFKLRPICIFQFEDAIILQEVNRILTEKIDCVFQKCSYAFRAKGNNQNIPTHHDTIIKLKKYLLDHHDDQIYIAECDLQKFFDSINHKKIRTAFRKALKDKRVALDSQNRDYCKKVLYAYLDAYDFQNSVLKLNDDEEFLNSHKCNGGEFGWIDENLLQQVYGKCYKNEMIGIPQGGALSGFIANLILNDVDLKITNLADNELLYLRYCDDMIMLHTNPSKLNIAFNLYCNCLKKLKLFIHTPQKITSYGKSFYDSKSKKPYMWGAVADSKIPWISFVGYQIGFKGETRVREKSIDNEIMKQQRVINQAIRLLNQNPCIKSYDLIINSITQRLIGMSVGRTRIFSPQTVINTMCWTNGFRMIEKNKFSEQQMKLLDRNRRKQIHRIHAFLEFNCYELPKSTNKNSINPMKKLPILYFGKKYSYYNWLENKGVSINERENQERISN